MVTIKQVSALSGVSKSTVSRVIANNGSVSKKTREKVEAAVAELGYRPNSFARSLKSNKSNIIGVVVVNMGSVFYAELLEGIENTFHGTDKHLMVTSTYGDKKSEFETISSLIDRQCDGLLLSLESDFTKDEIQKLCNRDIPIVMVGRNGLPYGYSSVQVDNKNGGYQAASFLIEQNRTKIVHLAGQQSLADARDRLDSFWQAVDDGGLERDDCQAIVGEFTEQFGYQATKQLIENNSNFDAICAGDDEIAAGVYVALREAGKRIPEDVAVIGYDDSFHARHMFPSLTSINQPITDLGRQAGKMLLDKMNGDSGANVNTVLGAELVKRDSV